MSKRLTVILKAILCLAVGGVVGYFIGAAKTGLWLRAYLMNSNASWLSQHIHYLAQIRTGRAQESAADIEKTLDNSIAQLSMAGRDYQGQFHPEKLPGGYLSALRAARVYADAGYRGAFSTASLRILDKVTPPAGKYCSPALRELQKASSKPATQPAVRPGSPQAPQGASTQPAEAKR
ncbi:hypothetical protein LCGC14_1158270 [marine sediment metagenome]|uniref:Uncharacterized protein n=1 Tax=marine sediment metagenome TaxID=412755 RepID=A0A0F9LYH5_9ZZZZ